MKPASQGGVAPGVELLAVRAEIRAEDVHAVSGESLQAAEGAQVPGRKGMVTESTQENHHGDGQD